MKQAKRLGLAMLALVILTTMPDAASATTLTSPSGTTYTSALKLENEGTVTLTSVFGGFGAVSCKKSTIEGQVQLHGTGVTEGGEITSFTFTECTGGSPTSPLAKRGTQNIHRNADGSGTFTFLGTEIIVHNTAFGTCTFKAPAVTGKTSGTLTTTTQTGGAATLDIGTSLESACGTATWEGAYKMTTPSTLLIDA